MRITNKILTAILMCMPLVAFAVDTSSISNAPDNDALQKNAISALDALEKDAKYSKIEEATRQQIISEAKKQLVIDSTDAGSANADGSSDSATPNDKEESDKSEEKSESDQDSKQSKLDEAQKKVDEAQAKLDKAKETEQSFANRMLGGLTTAATGLGAMQLAQGISEKKADSAADKDMDAYIATMRCTYGDGKSVKWGQEPVELPGGNNSELMKYRSEYLALADELKALKAGLDLKPGIEAEEILDKASTGLYDDENTGVTGGSYASRYRAAAGNEKDQKGLAADKKEAKTRMIAGGVVAGVGLVGGMVGNSLINGKLGELIKKNKDKKASEADNKKAIEKLKDKATYAGLKDPGFIDTLGLESYNIGNYITIIDQEVAFKPRSELEGQYIQTLCPTLKKECADNLLTEKSRGAVLAAAAAVEGKDKGVIAGTITEKGKLLGNTGKIEELTKKIPGLGGGETGEEAENEEKSAEENGNE